MRVQSNHAIAYMFRNSFPLLFFAIVPAVLLGLFAGNEGALRFLNAAAEWWNQGGVIAEVTVGKEMLFDFTIVRLANVEGLIVLVGFVLYVFSTGIYSGNGGASHATWSKIFKRSDTQRLFRNGKSRSVYSVARGYKRTFHDDSRMTRFLMEEIGATMRFVIVFAMALLVLAKILFCSIVGLLLCSLPVSQCDDYKLNVAMSYSLPSDGQTQQHRAGFGNAFSVQQGADFYRGVSAQSAESGFYCLLPVLSVLDHVSSLPCRKGVFRCGRRTSQRS